MRRTYLEHSMVIYNFVIKIGNQIKDSLCRVFGDSGISGIPRFVMEVLSDSTEEYDRNEKMQIYCKVGVSEYWIVDWRKKQIEIYMLFPNFKITFEELFDLG